MKQLIPIVVVMLLTATSPAFAEDEKPSLLKKAGAAVGKVFKPVKTGFRKVGHACATAGLLVSSGGVVIFAYLTKKLED